MRQKSHFFKRIAQIRNFQHISVDLWRYRNIVWPEEIPLLDNDIACWLHCNKMHHQIPLVVTNKYILCVVTTDSSDTQRWQYYDCYIYQVDRQPNGSGGTCRHCVAYEYFPNALNKEECHMALFVTNLSCIGWTWCISRWFCRKWDVDMDKHNRQHTLQDIPGREYRKWQGSWDCRCI